jgi:hypothetical protein
MLDQELRLYVGNEVQVVTPVEVVSGVLVAVSDSAVTVHAAQYPGYGGGEDIAIHLNSISYIRVTE